MTDVEKIRPLTPVEAAAYISTPEHPVSVNSLAMMRSRGTGPRYAKPTPNRVFYFKNDIDEWYRDSMRRGTGEDMR